jgi:hypothetical protein
LWHTNHIELAIADLPQVLLQYFYTAFISTTEQLYGMVPDEGKESHLA